MLPSWGETMRIHSIKVVVQRERQTCLSERKWGEICRTYSMVGNCLLELGEARISGLSHRSNTVILRTGMSSVQGLLRLGPLQDRDREITAPNSNLHLQGLSWNSSIRTLFTYLEST